MKETTYEEMLNFLKSIDSFENLSTYTETQLTESFKNGVMSFFDKERMDKKAVLGIDIYRYSKFLTPNQNYIPFIFEHLFNRTITFCNSHLKYFFQNYTPEKFKKCLVTTGDGGFVMLCTPLHCLLFAIAFELNLRSYNTHSIFQQLRHFTSDINLRYAITYDDLFIYEKNFYGPAIINNARILTKDRLNRLLYDVNVNNWFLCNLGGVESLQIYTLDRIATLPEFKDYDPSKIGDKPLILNKNYKSNIKTMISSKIGTIASKETRLDLYNLFAQIEIIEYDDTNPNINKWYLVSIGNQNASGLEIE
jgi:hypothetical protein